MNNKQGAIQPAAATENGTEITKTASTVAEMNTQAPITKIEKINKLKEIWEMRAVKELKQPQDVQQSGPKPSEHASVWHATVH